MDGELDDVTAWLSRWFDISEPASPYQEIACVDGRRMWRPRAMPEDTAAPEWRPGRPPMLSDKQ